MRARCHDNELHTRGHTRAPQDLSKELVKLGAEHGQLEGALGTDRGAAEGLEQTIADTEKARTKALADHKKAKTAVEKAKAAHDERASALHAKQEQYEAQMGLASASGDGAKNLQARNARGSNVC